MKREDVVAGGEYATDLGEHVRIADEEPGEDGAIPLPSAGWSVRDGEWVQEEHFGQRKTKEGGYKAYQTNVALRAVNVDTGERMAVEPRRLTLPWPEHVEALRKANEEREQAESNAAALRVRAQKAGATKVLTDLRKHQVSLSFADFDKVLRKAKV
jgi:hypothetical protein